MTKENSTDKKVENTDVKGIKQFWCKIIEQKGLTRKAEWMNGWEKELQGYEKGTEVDMHLLPIKETHKKISYWKTPDHYSIYVFCFTQFSSIPESLTFQLSTCPSRSKNTQVDD